MANFNFITIPELRQGLESDYKELQACLKAEAWKAVQVLAGSIVEAILIDALSGTGVNQVTLESMDLAPLIEMAKEKGMLDGEAVDLSTVIRKYRNLIHPGRVKRLEKSVDHSGAVIAAELVEVISTQVARKKQQTYGYTAEQLFERLRGGSSALPLVNILLRDAPKAEVERFLIKVLPAAYFDGLSNSEVTSEQVRHLLTCYRRIFDATHNDVKTKVMKHMYEVFRHDPEGTVLVYEDNFFKGADLAYLCESERRFIKAHFLPRVTGDTLGERLANLSGIGPYLEPDEAGDLVLTLVLAATGDDEDLAKRARNRLLSEYSKMTTENRNFVRDCADGLNATEILEKLKEREARIKPPTEKEAA
jgi:hypothetical protein